MSGPDQPAQPYRPYRPQDGVQPDDSETTVVDARALGGDRPDTDPVDTGSSEGAPQAWSRSAGDDAPTTATPYPRAYRPVDDEDPTDAPLADTPGTFGGAPTLEQPDERPASPYERSAPTTAEQPSAVPTPGGPGTEHSPAPTSGYAEQETVESRASQWPSGESAGRVQNTPPPTAESRSPEPTAAASSTDHPGSTAAYQPFQSAAQPAVAPFPSSAGGLRSDSPHDDATRALPSTGDAQDPFARPYPPAPEPLAQPEYIPPPQQQPNTLDERDTFIGQPARPDEPELLPEKRRTWQNLLGALIGLVLVLGPIVGFALLAGTPDSLFDAALARRFLLLGIIVIAAVPALLAGWAPATAWLPGGMLAVVGVIAFLSNSFTVRLRSWSQSLLGTEVAGTFLAQYAVVIGFVLLFAGLGTAWARSSGAESVIRRIPTRG